MKRRAVCCVRLSGGDSKLPAVCWFSLFRTALGVVVVDNGGVLFSLELNLAGITL